MSQAYIPELIECREELDNIAKKLFELDPNQESQTMPQGVLFALWGIIIYIRIRVIGIVSMIHTELEIQHHLTEEAWDKIFGNLCDSMYRDDDLQGFIVQDIAIHHRNELPISFIERYQDIIHRILEYCTTGNRWALQWNFKDISIDDYTR